jgi:chromate transporter
VKEFIELLRAFVVIGATTFGGGYAMLPILDRELIKKRGWVTMDELLDYYTIAQITPGIIAVNVATFVGYKRKGLAGGIIATIGFVLPGVSLMILLSLFITRFAEYRLVQHAFAGIRIAVCALILDTILKLSKGFFKNFKSIAVFAIAFALSAVFSVSPAYIILGAGLAGFLLFSPKREKKQEADSSAAPKMADSEKEDGEP